MAMRVAPSFEQLEKLSGTRDADLIARKFVDPALNRGRGAQTNKGSRFDKQSREAVDDGWGQVEDLKPFETIEHVARSTPIVAASTGARTASRGRRTPISAIPQGWSSSAISM